MNKSISISATTFSSQILSWFDHQGRKSLPWQQNKTPYRVWVSEIMLQQTQVSTVIPYFQRFVEKFPDVAALANAPEDEVLHIWTGLGYYSRARNLHKTARIIVSEYNSIFPDDIERLQLLPGIGLSTAGAIIAIAFQKKATILDGNVKRVLTRFQGINEWPGEKKTLQTLWSLAEKYTPTTRIADYTQAIMDIGATICTRGKPRCHVCPIKTHCVAFHQNLQSEIPKSKPKTKIPTRYATLFIFMNHHQTILLEKRPSTGIWGGLWSLPQENEWLNTDEIKHRATQQFPFAIQKIERLQTFRHTFSHFHLEILPVLIRVKENRKRKVMAADSHIWYNLQSPEQIGLPAPVKKLLMEILTCPA